MWAQQSPVASQIAWWSEPPHELLPGTFQGPFWTRGVRIHRGGPPFRFDELSSARVTDTSTWAALGKPWPVQYWAWNPQWQCPPHSIPQQVQSGVEQKRISMVWRWKCCDFRGGNYFQPKLLSGSSFTPKDFEIPVFPWRCSSNCCRDNQGAQTNAYPGWKVPENQLPHWPPFLGFQVEQEASCAEETKKRTTQAVGRHQEKNSSKTLQFCQFLHEEEQAVYIKIF